MSTSAGSTQTPSNAVPIALAVLASVCGTLVSAALGLSPTLKLVGAALGAAIPPLVVSAGRFRPLRVATAVLIAIGALFVTYSGITLSDYAIQREASTFPIPDVLPTTGPDTSTEVSTDTDEEDTPTPPTPTCEGELCILVTPSELSCTADGCFDASANDRVTVHNAGTVPLRVNDLEFDGEAAAGLSLDVDPDADGQCEQVELVPGASCSIVVHLAPGHNGAARLIIHQNLKGPASYVAIVADGGPPLENNVDLVLAEGPVCSVAPVGEFGEGILTVLLPIANSGADPFAGTVTVSLTSDSGLSAVGSTEVAAGTSTGVIELPVDLNDFPQATFFTVQVDPDGEFAETDEANNALGLTVELPALPDDAGDAVCYFS